MKTSHLVSNVKKYTTETYKKSNSIHLTILKGNQTVLSLPLTFGAVIISLYPFLSLFTTAFLLKHHYTIKLHKEVVIYKRNVANSNQF